MPRAASGSDSPRNASSAGPSPSLPRPLSRSPPLSPRRASSLPVNDVRLSISTTAPGTSTDKYGGAGGRRKDVAAGVSLAKEGQGFGRSPRSVAGRTRTRLARNTVGLLSALGLLALVPLRGTFQAPSPPSLPYLDDLPWDKGAAFTRGALVDQPGREELGKDSSLTFSEGGLGEGAGRGGEWRSRCWTDEEGEGRCLPTVFFVGVSKCGTTSLSNWLAEHPRAVFVPPAEGHDFKEAHVFDFSPKFWHDLTSWARRDLLSPVAAPQDTVIDFTPNYSVVGETPLRISDFFGVGGSKNEGPLRRDLRFLVVLREPVARTISSWVYKSDPGSAQPVLHQKNGTIAEGNTNVSVNSSSTATSNTGFSTATARRQSERRLRWTWRPRSKGPNRGEHRRRRLAMATVEQRSLRQAFREGVARAESLAGCTRNATDSGLFGREAMVTFCRATKGKKQCNGNPPCELCNTHTEPWCNPRDYLEEPLYNAHVGKSMYAPQLRRWFSVFGRESFKVVFTEDMQVDPVKTLTEVLDFLGLDLHDPEGEKGLRSPEMWDAIVGARYNTADGAKKKVLDPQVTPELREEMQAFFVPHNRDLEELLGVPLPKSWGVQA